MKRHTLRRRYGRAMVDAKSMARDLHAAGSLAVHDPRTGSSFTITTFGRQAGKRGVFGRRGRRGAGPWAPHERGAASRLVEQA